MDEAKALEIDAWSEAQNIRALYFLARADCVESTRCAEKHGFNLVDVRLTLEHEISRAHGLESPARNSPTLIRPVQAVDVPHLQAIAIVSHRDTRFFSDNHFPRATAESFYATWIALECQGRADAVLVAVSPSGNPLGYTSCHVDATRGSGNIGLVGVSPEARGKGLGQALVFAALDWFASRKVTHVAVVTQARNAAAQRLYQRCGFVTHQVQLWFHKWYSTDEG